MGHPRVERVRVHYFSPFAECGGSVAPLPRESITNRFPLSQACFALHKCLTILHSYMEKAAPKWPLPRQLSCFSWSACNSQAEFVIYYAGDRQSGHSGARNHALFCFTTMGIRV
jgi:hypothetical protein